MAIIYHSEGNIYINKKEDKLSLKKTDKDNKPIPELLLRGLNKVKIELDEDPILGDLNTLLLEYAFWNNNHWVNLEIVPQFTNWNQPGTLLFRKLNKPSKIKIESVKKLNGMVYLIVNGSTNPAESLHFRIFSEDQSELDNAVNHFSKEKNVCEVISLFEQKKNKIDNVFATIQTKLHQNRNLGEDYLCLEIVDKVEIAVCADIEIETGTDAIEVMSLLQSTIDRIINPKINFYTLAQLVNEGLHSEDIFMGPKLTHGFLKDDEIDKAQLPTEIYASDIIAELMEIPGVKSVKNLLMTAYNILGKPITDATNQKWVLKLPGDVKAVFNSGKSKLLLFQKGIPFLLSENQQMLVEQKVIQYNSLVKQKKLQNINNDFETENGEHYQLDTYYSIQNDFPATYSIGKNYVSEKAPSLKKAQAKQLKGYLYFYEQLLADFFGQLYNAKDLLDTKTINKTYASRFLDTDDSNGLEFYSKEVFSDTLSSALNNGESDYDNSLYESKNLFYDRRNRALDHLMARFAESFNDYVFMMYRVSQDTSGMGELTFDYEDLITDKQNFINSYPEISSKRGLGIDYLNASVINNQLEYNDLWNNGHRSGYEKRVARLLGINSIGLRNIVTEENPQTQWTVNTETEDYLFKILAPNTGLQEKWDWAQHHFLDQTLYKIDKYGGKYYIYLTDETVKIARADKKFTTEQDAYNYLQKMIRALNIYYENFFCLEHILLRPFNGKSFTDDDLLSVCLNDDCNDEANNDPYSFKATIILPGYLSRFKNLIFREYAENILRQEAPAHILLKICWVNIDDMLGFQKKYRAWLNLYRRYRMQYCSNKLSLNQEKQYKKALNELVAALKELNTIYPEGNLYDCQLSESIRPIILGNTSLGTL